MPEFSISMRVLFIIPLNMTWLTAAWVRMLQRVVEFHNGHSGQHVKDDENIVNWCCVCHTSYLTFQRVVESYEP